MKKLVLLIAMLYQPCSWAVDAREFDTPEQQQTYAKLIAEIRCLVCQNQNIADSNADLAKDLRRQVHEMVLQNKTEQDIVEFMVQRYGDFVLYKPLFKVKTLLLWLGPVVFIVIGLIVVFFYTKRNRKPVANELDQQQKDHLRKLLENEDELH